MARTAAERLILAGPLNAGVQEILRRTDGGPVSVGDPRSFEDPDAPDGTFDFHADFEEAGRAGGCVAVRLHLLRSRRVPPSAADLIEAAEARPDVALYLLGTEEEAWAFAEADPESAAFFDKAVQVPPSRAEECMRILRS